MPPSAGACQTIDALLKPDCGRASAWSSTITAIGCSAARSGLTRTPSSGAATSVGLGTGVGVGLAVGEAVAAGVAWPGEGEGGRVARAIGDGEDPVEDTAGAMLAAARPAMALRPSASATTAKGAARLIRRF